MSDAEPAIGKRMARAGLWMILQRVAWRGAGLATTIILARLLVPEDFGLVAVATTIFGVVDALSHFGFNQALIRNQNAGRDEYDTAWTLSIARGVVSGGGIALCAGFAADFFEDPRLYDVMLVLAALCFVRGLQNIGVIDFHKQLWFGQDLKFRLIARAGYFVAAVILGLAWHSYWALIAGICAEFVLLTVLSYVMHDYRPRLSLRAWREILGFSKWYLASNVIAFFNDRSDYFVVSKLVGLEILGFYTVARQVSTLASIAITEPTTQPLFAGFAKIADNRPLLADMYLKALSMLAMVGIPMVVGVICTADLLVGILFGAGWQAAVPFVEILALYGLARITFGSASRALMAMGKLKTNTVLEAIQLAVLLPLLLWGVNANGAHGAAWAVVAAAAIRSILNISVLSRVLQLRLTDLVSAIWRTAAAALAMASTVLVMRFYLPPAETLLSQAGQLTVVVAVAAACYGAVLLALWALSGFPNSSERHLMTMLRQGAGQMAAFRGR